jgi:hypothetical protein
MKNNVPLTLVLLLVIPGGQLTVNSATPKAQKPRVVLTHDPELDDLNTLIRAMLYSCDFKVEGLIYCSGMFHFKGDNKGTTQFIAGREYDRMGRGPVTSWRWAEDDHYIDEIVDAYGQVYANLKVHHPDYPTPAELKSTIKWGNVEFEGDFSKDTEGSNLIKSLLLDDQPGPLFVTAGGGQSTIARALKSIYDQYSKTAQWDLLRDKVSHKLVIIPWGDQDGTNARYIRPNWPGISTWLLAMIEFGYGARDAQPPENQVYLSADWTRTNVSSRGPLGAMYRVWGDGKQMAKGDMTDYFGFSGLTSSQLREKGYMVWTAPQEKGYFISEGDTPTYMNLLDNGLRAYEDGYWGGWGGRRRAHTEELGGTDSGTNHTQANPDDPGVAFGLVPAGSTAKPPQPPPAPAGGIGGFGPGQISAKTAQINAKFFAAAQNDFAARLKWSVSPKFEDANHQPNVSIKGPLAVAARPGETVRLEAEVFDPDRDPVVTAWWQYLDAGSYPGEISLSNTDSLTTSLNVPSDAQPGQTIHVILEATDHGTPSLTRYQRVVVTVR